MPGENDEVIVTNHPSEEYYGIKDKGRNTCQQVSERHGQLMMPLRLLTQVLTSGVIKKMKVLVTGAAGLYGVHLVETLVKNEDIARVYGVDNFSRPFLTEDPFFPAPEMAAKFVLRRCRYQDLTAAELDELELDAIIHLAAYVSIDESMVVPAVYFWNNEYGTFKFVHTLGQTKSKPLLLCASSPEVYGNPRYLPMDEEHPLYPRSVYAVSKLAAEKHANALHEWFAYPVIVIRNFNTYGENQNLAGYAAVIPRFIVNALQGQPLVVHNDGSQTRDFLYIGDAVRAYVMILQERERLQGEVFNIGTGKQTAIRELAQLIKDLTASTSPITPARGRPGDLQGLAADITKIQNAVGWSPCFSLEEGLNRTIEWYRRYI